MLEYPIYRLPPFSPILYFYLLKRGKKERRAGPSPSQVGPALCSNMHPVLCTMLGQIAVKNSCREDKKCRKNKEKVVKPTNHVVRTRKCRN